MRIRVQAYGNGKSKSARLLARELGVLRLKSTGSRFRGKNGDVIINWGKPKTIHANVTYLNPIEAVAKASNKLIALETLDREGVSIPKVFKELISPPEDMKLVARTTLYGHSGKGIVVGTQRELYDMGINAPLYTQYIEKKAEYRVIVVGDEAVDIKIKKKKRDWTGERSETVWNHSNGYVFVRNDGVFNCMLPDVGVYAVKALGLKYGAVDIIEDDNDLYVLEVNTPFGLEGTTIKLVADAIK
jgi:glutathione synthase/RimK-type ligase-like ATP-grasp enzyme